MDSGDGGSHTSLIDGPMVRLSCANTLSYSRVLGSAKSRGKWLYEPDAEIEFSATEFWCQQVGPSSIMLQKAQTRKPSEFLCFFLLVLGFGLLVVVFCGLVAGALSAWFRVFFPGLCGLWSNFSFLFVFWLTKRNSMQTRSLQGRRATRHGKWLG